MLLVQAVLNFGGEGTAVTRRVSWVLVMFYSLICGLVWGECLVHENVLSCKLVCVLFYIYIVL